MLTLMVQLMTADLPLTVVVRRAGWEVARVATAVTETVAVTADLKVVVAVDGPVQTLVTTVPPVVILEVCGQTVV